jgi:hypothetical protein
MFWTFILRWQHGSVCVEKRNAAAICGECCNVAGCVDNPPNGATSGTKKYARGRKAIRIIGANIGRAIRDMWPATISGESAPFGVGVGVVPQNRNNEIVFRRKNQVNVPQNRNI